MEWLKLPWRFRQQARLFLGEDKDRLNFLCWCEDEVSMAVLQAQWEKEDRQQEAPAPQRKRIDRARFRF